MCTFQNYLQHGVWHEILLEFMPEQQSVSMGVKTWTSEYFYWGNYLGCLNSRYAPDLHLHLKPPFWYWLNSYQVIITSAMWLNYWRSSIWCIDASINTYQQVFSAKTLHRSMMQHYNIECFDRAIYTALNTSPLYKQELIIKWTLAINSMNFW